MPRSLAAAVAALVLVPALLPAQQAGGFVTLKGADTVAVERFTRDTFALTGRLLREPPGREPERIGYAVTVLADGTTPLLELSAWRGSDAEDGPARQSTRIIFKDDSVAVDEANRGSGVLTRLLPTQAAAVPYLNLSTAFLEFATRRAVRTGGSASLPFFNLGGGQTITGTVARLGSDSALVRLGTVEFRFRLDADGGILGGQVPAQGLVIVRTAGR